MACNCRDFWVTYEDIKNVPFYNKKKTFQKVFFHMNFGLFVKMGYIILGSKDAFYMVVT